MPGRGGRPGPSALAWPCHGGWLPDRPPVHWEGCDATDPSRWNGKLRFGSTGCGAAWLARLLWEQEAAGSNPAIPTRSEHMSILMRLGLGAKLGAMCYRFVRGGP